MAASPAPASGTFSCAETDWEKADDFFNDWIEVYDYQGTGVGTSGNPTAWVNTTHTLTFKPAATLTAGDKVEMHQRFTVATYNDFINMAIEMVAKEALLDKVDSSIELEESVYSYTIPVQFLYIYELEMESEDEADLYDGSNIIDRHAWNIVNGKIEFVVSLFTPTDGQKLRIKGLASPSILDTDSEACPINPAYVIQQTLSFLHQSLIRGPDKDSEYHAGQMSICETKANIERARFQITLGSAIPVEA